MTGSDRPPVVSRLPWLAVAVFLVVLAVGQAGVGMRASRTASITGDEPFYMLTAQSLLSDGDLDLTDEYAGHEYREFWDGSVELWKQMEPAPDGRLLSPHEPGLSLLVLPAYAAFGLEGVQRFLVVLWALAMALAAVAAARFAAPPTAAALAAITVGAGAPGVVYGSQVYPEAAAALCVAAVLMRLGGPLGPARPLLTAGVLVALAWLGVKYVPVAGLLFAAWAWRYRGERGSVTVAAAVAALAAAHYAWWHVATFGGLTPYGTNVVWAGEGTAEVLDAHFRVQGRTYRLYGLFLDARFGLFRWLPVAPLALWGLGRRRSVPGLVVAGAVLMGTFASITIMGWWFPGRMLVVALPALAVLIAAGISRWPRTALVLSAWSLAIGAAVVWSARTGGIRLAVDPFDLGFPLPPARLFPDFRTFDAREVSVSLVWLVLLAGARIATRRGRVRSATPA